jgi:cytochrome P450 family 110
MPNTLRGPRSALLSAINFSRGPADFAARGIERYGDPFVAPLPTGTVAITGDPEGFREILTADSSIFEPYAAKFMEPAVGPNSLVLIGGERHKRERRLLMPPFHASRMQGYAELMRQSAHEAAEGLKPGTVVTAQLLTQAVSIDIITRAVFGVEGNDRVRHFIDTLLAYGQAYVPLLAFAVPLRRPFGGFGPWARFQRVAAQLDALMTEQLESRRTSYENRTDMISLLLATRDEEGNPMSDVEIKDELRTMLLAGFETTAITMAWVLYRLHRHTEVKQKLEEELSTVGTNPSPEALVKLPYLGLVIDETLRLYPPLPVLTRKLKAPFTLRGHELPPGMGLMPFITLVHSNPTLFPEPERFRPERFLERKYSPFEYLPYGGGFRRCLGAAFAQYELKVVLGTLLAGHRFSQVHDRPVRAVLRNVMTGPRDPILLRYEGPVRAAAAAA